PSNIVLRLQAVDRDDDLEPPQPGPFNRDRPDRARHDLRMDSALRELRKNLSKVAIADEWFAPDNRHVNRAMPIDERHEPLDELVTLVVVEPAQRDVAAKMLVAVRVAAGATKRALARDLDRDVRAIAGKDAAPCMEDITCGQTFVNHGLLLSSVILFCTHACRADAAPRCAAP